MTSPHTIRNHSLRESEASLPPGRWVPRGAIKVFEPDHPELAYFDVADISEITNEQDAWDTIAANLAAVSPINTAPIVTELCDHCGCLLLPAERCPACLVWALKSEQQWRRVAV